MARTPTNGGGGSVSSSGSPWKKKRYGDRIENATVDRNKDHRSPWQRLNDKGDGKPSLGEQWKKSKVRPIATLNNASRQERYKKNALQNAAKRRLMENGTNAPGGTPGGGRVPSTGAGSSSGKSKRLDVFRSRVANSAPVKGIQRERNFEISQKAEIKRRFGGDTNKALAAMRREAARQRVRKMAGGK